MHGKKSINHRAIDKCCSSSIIGHQMNYKCADSARGALLFWFLLHHVTNSLHLSQSDYSVKIAKINFHFALILPKSRHFNYNNNNTNNLCLLL